MRLIDADALRNTFDAMHAMPGCSHLEHLVLLGIKKYIDDSPTIDAAPAVRCKECKHRGDADVCPMLCEVYYGFETERYDTTEDDGFCHLAEKMDGGADDAAD